MPDRSAGWRCGAAEERGKATNAPQVAQAMLEVAELLSQEKLEKQHLQVVVMVEEVYQIQFQVQY